MKFKNFSVQQKEKVLTDLRQFMDEMKTVFDLDTFLCGGLLLGSQREKDLIPHDADLDIYYISKFSDRFSREAVAEKNNIWDYYKGLNRNKKYFKSSISTQFHIWFSDKKLEHGNPGKTNMVDLFGCWGISNEYFILSGNYRAYECKIPDCVLPLKTINFKNIEFKIPNKTEDFLDFFYGQNWRNSFLCPKFPPGEIIRAVDDGVLWEYWVGSKDKPKKLTGFGRKKLGYIKLNKDGTVEWCGSLHKSWEFKNNNIILYNNNIEYILYSIGKNTYETIDNNTYIRIKKIVKNND